MLVFDGCAVEEFDHMEVMQWQMLLDECVALKVLSLRKLGWCPFISLILLNMCGLLYKWFSRIAQRSRSLQSVGILILPRVSCVLLSTLYLITYVLLNGMG